MVKPAQLRNRSLTPISQTQLAVNLVASGNGNEGSTFVCPGLSSCGDMLFHTFASCRRFAAPAGHHEGHRAFSQEPPWLWQALWMIEVNDSLYLREQYRTVLVCCTLHEPKVSYSTSTSCCTVIWWIFPSLFLCTFPIYLM